MYGEYLKMNNPHKASLYLASGFPIIVWSQSALADFVRKNQCGIIVDSLFEIADCLNSIDEEDYQELIKNSKIVGEKLNGYFLKTALENVKGICRVYETTNLTKMTRYRQILKYYGLKLTCVYFLHKNLTRCFMIFVERFFWILY